MDSPDRSLEAGDTTWPLETLEKAWIVLADPMNIPNLYPEIEVVEWVGEYRQAEVGAVFRCYHRAADSEQFTTLCVVTEYDRPRTVAWEVHRDGYPSVVCRFELWTSGGKVAIGQTVNPL
jgi:hypothetical protein